MFNESLLPRAIRSNPFAIGRLLQPALLLFSFEFCLTINSSTVAQAETTSTSHINLKESLSEPSTNSLTIGTEAISTKDLLQDKADPEPSFRTYFGLEARDLRDQRRERPQNANQTTLEEARFGLEKDIGKSLTGRIEISIEDFSGESVFYLRDAWAKWKPWEFVDLQVGQFFQPIGWFGPEDFWFVHLPSYYDQLFKGDKPIDVGLYARVRPFNSEWFQLEGGCFRGQVFREGDGRFEQPEQEPCLVSARSKGPYHEFFWSHYRHDLAFFDPIRAYGAGVHLKTPLWTQLNLGASVFAEQWWITEEQALGVDVATRGRMIYPNFQIWKFHGGIRLGDTRRRFAYEREGSFQTLFEEQVLRAELRIFDEFLVIYEDTLEVSSEFRIQDDRALRVLFRSDY